MQAPTDTRIFERAVSWIEAFKEGRGDRAAFFAWLAESPRHVEELQFALALTEEISGLTPQDRAQIEALAAREGGIAADPTANVVPLGARGTPPATRPFDKHPRRPWALAAALLLAIAAGWAALESLGADTYVTQVGEQRSLQLQDGSTVHLNARSRLKVRFTAGERRLELLEGEALFKVAHEATRPFRVSAGDSVIQAVGTQFNVRRQVSSTVVSVLEGAVRVEKTGPAEEPAALLKAREEIRIPGAGKMHRRVMADATNAIAWRQHRLVFQGDTLADIAAEFNRYNTAPRIRIEGDAATRHFAGTFDADAPEALIEALTADGSLTVARGNGEIVVRAANSPRAPGDR